VVMTDCSSSFASGCVPWVVSPCDSACRVSGVFRLSLPVDLSFGSSVDDNGLVLSILPIIINT
jgi:hypothetical protein